MRRTHKSYGDQLLQISSNLILFSQRLEIKLLHFQVRFFSKDFSFKDSLFTAKTPFLSIRGSPFSTDLKPSLVNEKPIPYSRSKTQIEIPPIDLSSIGKSLVSRYSYLWEKKRDDELSLRELLLKLSDISPESVRGFWRVSSLEPKDVNEILVGFDFDVGKAGIERKKVEFLWRLFGWATAQSKEFDHVPESYSIMASMLTRVGLLEEAECLVRKMGTLGILSSGNEIASKIIEGYVGIRDLDSSVSMYNWCRSKGLVPSKPCYGVLLQFLIRNKNAKLSFQVYNDMVDLGFGPNDMGNTMLELVVKLLCKKGKIKEARNFHRKVLALGYEPSLAVINLIANGYCDKRDFEDLLIFLSESKFAPDPPVCNKILWSQCRNFGTRKAYMFMQELEHLGFTPDELTFGILIGWSCKEEKLKDAFIYVSELLSRHLKIDVYSYNALISGLFGKGMWKHAGEIFNEMLGRGVKPEASTFRVLLAGYCKFRRFDEAKEIIREMVNHGLVKMSSLDDPLAKAFMFLGFDPLSIKVKRDNDAVLRKTEFFDNLGNGLYLETDIDEYEKSLTEILEDALLPDFNPLVVKNCHNGDIGTALMLKENIVRRGDKLSLTAYSTLINSLCLSRSHLNTAVRLLEEMDELTYQLDQESLNFIVQRISKKRFPFSGRILLQGMHRRDILVENDTYSAIIMGLCMKGSPKEVNECWQLAQKYKWLPTLKDCKPLVGCLCQLGMLKEVVELLKSMLETYGHQISSISPEFLEELCAAGFTNIGYIFMEEIEGNGLVLDHLSYSYLIRGFCKEKRIHEAFKVLDTMLEKNMTPCLDVCSLLIPQLCRFSKLEKALDLKEIILREEPKASVSLYELLVQSLCKMHRIEESTLLYQEMLMKGYTPDTEVYNALIQGYSQHYNSRKVEELLGVMVRKNISLTILSYRNLVRLMCMQGKVIHALSMKELTLRENKPPILILYNILIFHLLQTGSSSAVTALVDEMHKKGVAPDECSYNFLIHGYSKCTDFTQSMDALKTMIDKDLRPSNRSLKIIISHLCGLGELNKSLELSRVMEHKGWVHGSVVQNAIVEGLLSHGRLQEAESYISRLEEKCLVPESINYDMLIKRFCSHGRPYKAVDLMNTMLKKGNLPNPTSYDAVIQGFCTCKVLDKALDLHAEMLAKNLKPSFKSWEVIVYELCADGRTTEADRLLGSMLQLGQPPTRSIYEFVIDRYCLENNISKASEVLNKMQRNGYEPDFKTHWSLISNLSNSNKEKSEGGGFLSKLLSFSGFSQKKTSNTKVG